jgi:hypothetical protein
MAVAGPSRDADVPAFWAAFGLPGLVDLHTHFKPANVLSSPRCGPTSTRRPRRRRPTPVAVRYRDDEPDFFIHVAEKEYGGDPESEQVLEKENA